MLQRGIACLIGCLLLTTAGLKLYGLNADAFAHQGLLSPSGQLVVVEWEFLLGLWLLSGRAEGGAWFAAVFTFLAFAGFSIYLASLGQESCGCFGAVRASPWVAFAFDGGALALLAIGRPKLPPATDQTSVSLRGSAALGIGAAVCAVMFGIGTTSLLAMLPDQVGGGLARLRGEQVSVRPGVVEMGRGEEGDVLEAAVEIVNWTGQPVTIIGGTSDCSCVATADLPMKLAPREARPVLVKVRLSGSPGLYRRKAWFWTDCEGSPTVQFGLTARVQQGRGEVETR